MTAPSKQPKRTFRTRTQWQAIIAEFERSGLGAGEFCRQRSLSYNSFASWRKRLREEGSTDGSTISFIPLPTQLQGTPQGSTWQIELNLGDGMVLRLNRGA